MAPLEEACCAIKKLLALAAHPGTPTEEAATADAKAEELLAAYAEGLSGAGAIANRRSQLIARAGPRIGPPWHWHRYFIVDRFHEGFQMPARRERVDPV